MYKQKILLIFVVIITMLLAGCVESDDEWTYEDEDENNYDPFDDPLNPNSPNNPSNPANPYSPIWSDDW